MPAFTFTAATNDILTTSGDHGLVTGSGPLVLRNIGGALPAATPSLAPLTEYWAILVDPNELKIATSQANALLGTAIDITGTGTGTHILEYGIPFRRARTYAALSQVKSADLNAVQDALVALHALQTGQAQSVWDIPQRCGFPHPINGSPPTNWTLTTGSENYWVCSNTGGSLFFTIPVDTYHPVTGLSLNVYGDGTADCTFTAWALTASQGRVQLATLTDSNRSAAWAELPLTAWTTRVMGAGECLLVEAAPAAFANYRIGNWRLSRDS